ncbi:MAG: hypothetical protein HY556_01545 [Euryarchaeota archaeon]|nr:hypothetical protein [Euryarchaeota archaeon]
MVTNARSDASVALLIASFITVFSFVRQSLSDPLGSVVATLAAGVAVFLIALKAVPWYRGEA